MKVSKTKSFDYWDVWEFVKGRKRTVVTLIGAILGYVITNDHTVAVVSGMIVEGIFSAGDFYFSEVKTK